MKQQLRPRLWAPIAIGLLLSGALYGCAASETPPTTQSQETTAPPEAPRNNELTDADYLTVMEGLWGSSGQYDFPFNQEEYLQVMRRLDQNDAVFIYGGWENASVDIADINKLLQRNGLKFADWYPIE